MGWVRVTIDVLVTEDNKFEEPDLTDVEYTEGAVRDHLKACDYHGPFDTVVIGCVKEVGCRERAKGTAADT